MNDAGKQIAILSLGQILAVTQESISDPKARETIEKHIRQVAAIIQDRPNNKPDQFTDDMMSQVSRILSPSLEVINA